MIYKNIDLFGGKYRVPVEAKRRAVRLAKGGAGGAAFDTLKGEGMTDEAALVVVYNAGRKSLGDIGRHFENKGFFLYAEGNFGAVAFVVEDTTDRGPFLTLSAPGYYKDIELQATATTSGRAVIAAQKANAAAVKYIRANAGQLAALIDEKRKK